MAIRFRLEGDLAGWGYPLLLVFLLGMFAVHPWAANSALGVTVIRLVYAGVLLGALFAVSRHRLVTTIGLLLALPAIIVGNVPAFAGGEWNTVSNLLAGIFIVIVAATILRDVFLHKMITMRTISGAVCVFLLLGLMWAFTYSVIEWFLPGSFEGLAPAGSQVRESQLFYFSFVTLTTLGYGDITPSRPEAMSLATLEAIVGQLYLVVLIAQLVGRRLVATVAGTPLAILALVGLGWSVAA